MRSEIVRDLLTEYEQQRMRNQEEEQRRRAEATAKCPGLSAALDERQQMIFSGLRRVMAGEMTPESLPARMELANRRVAELLKAGGFAADWLDPVYRCAACRDTGYVGEPVREMCACMRRRLYDRLYREVGLEGTQTQTFERFDLSIFSAEKLPGRSFSQRDMMAVSRDWAEDWANHAPDAPQKTVVLMGQSGLGKTYLLHAMAHRLLERGKNVLVISAYRFIDVARKAYFGGSSEDLDAIMATDVLMVDDLGSEPLMEQVTVTQWFNLINERQTRGQTTVFSTNLMQDDLRRRYTERIASRLLDTQNAKLLLLVGDDIRRK